MSLIACINLEENLIFLSLAAIYLSTWADVKPGWLITFLFSSYLIQSITDWTLKTDAVFLLTLPYALVALYSDVSYPLKPTVAANLITVSIIYTGLVVEFKKSNILFKTSVSELALNLLSLEPTKPPEYSISIDNKYASISSLWSIW